MGLMLDVTLGIVLDSRLSFEEHLRLVSGKINKTIGLLRKLQCLIPRSSLLDIYKTCRNSS